MLIWLRLLLLFWCFLAIFARFYFTVLLDITCPTPAANPQAAFLGLVMLIVRCRQLLAVGCYIMPLPVPGPDEEDHTRWSRLQRCRRLLRHVPFQLLGVRQMEGSHHRRQAADDERTSDVHAFAELERVLGGAVGKGLCQVRVSAV